MSKIPAPIKHAKVDVSPTEPGIIPIKDSDKVYSDVKPFKF